MQCVHQHFQFSSNPDVRLVPNHRFSREWPDRGPQYFSVRPKRSINPGTLSEPRWIRRQWCYPNRRHDEQDRLVHRDRAAIRRKHCIIVKLPNDWRINGGFPYSVWVKVAASATATSGDIALLMHMEAMWAWRQTNNSNFNQHWLAASALCECHIAVDVHTGDKSDGTQWFILRKKSKWKKKRKKALQM